MTDPPSVIAEVTSPTNPTTPVADRPSEQAATQSTLGPPSLSADPESVADLSSQVLCDADHKLIRVYGDTIHRNDGRHLTGGIADDSTWQDRFDAVTASPHPLYLPPQGRIGDAVVAAYAAKLRGIRDQSWNSERPLTFLTCILRRRAGCIRARNIKRRIEQRLGLWADGSFDALVDDTRTEALSSAGALPHRTDDDTVARRFNTMVLDGTLRAAVRTLTSHDGGGVLGPYDACTKTGRPVHAILREKHPPPHTGSHQPRQYRILRLRHCAGPHPCGLPSRRGRGRSQ